MQQRLTRRGSVDDAMRRDAAGEDQIMQHLLALEIHLCFDVMRKAERLKSGANRGVVGGGAEPQLFPIDGLRLSPNTHVMALGKSIEATLAQDIRLAARELHGAHRSVAVRAGFGHGANRLQAAAARDAIGRIPAGGGKGAFEPLAIAHEEQVRGINRFCGKRPVRPLGHIGDGLGEARTFDRG